MPQTILTVRTSVFSSAILDSKGDILAESEQGLVALAWDSPMRVIRGDLNEDLLELQEAIRKELNKVALHGATPEEELPVKRGSQVRIPKGLEVKTTRKIRRYLSGKAHLVKVNHILGGSCEQIGFVSKDGSVRHNGAIPWYREEEIQKIYGCKSEELLNHPFIRLRGNWLYIPLTNPTVVWAGTGGYWCEVDMSQVLPA